MKISAAPRRFDRGDVDFLHAHHGIECALCFIAAGRHRLCQHTRRDLPGDAPLVLAPATRTLLASIADNSVPVAVGLLLIIGGDLKRESFVMLERGTAVEAHTRHAGDCEFYHQHVALLAGGEVTGRTIDGAHGAVGKGFGIETGSSLCVLVVPQANRVLGHCLSFRWAYAPFGDAYAPRTNVRVYIRHAKWAFFILAHLAFFATAMSRPDRGCAVTAICRHQRAAASRQVRPYVTIMQMIRL